MDQRLALKNFCLNYHKVTAVSTMHPLFLTQNLTQIVCMLEGLRMMKDNWTMASYAETTAVNIWCQLSDYARDRITGTLVDLMGLAASWYKEISQRAELVKDNIFSQYFESDASEMENLLTMENNDFFPLPQAAPIFREDGVEFVYQQYEIACYAAGMPACVISYDLLEPFLTQAGKWLVNVGHVAEN